MPLLWAGAEEDLGGCPTGESFSFAEGGAFQAAFLSTTEVKTQDQEEEKEMTDTDTKNEEIRRKYLNNLSFSTLVDKMVLELAYGSVTEEELQQATRFAIARSKREKER